MPAAPSVDVSSSSSTTTTCRSRRRSARLSTYLAQARVGPDLLVPIRSLRRTASQLAAALGPRARSPRDRRVRARLLHRRHAVRGAGLPTMSARSTVTISTISCRCFATSATPPTGRSSCTSSPRRARAIRRRRRRPTNSTASGRFDVITGAQAKSGTNVPTYTEIFGRSADRRRPSAIEDRRASPPRCRPVPGYPIFAARFPRAVLRRRHCRAACGDLCRRASRRRG